MAKKSKTRKLIFIGPLLLGDVPFSGDVAKNRLFLNKFSEFFDCIYAFDTMKCRKSLFELIKMLIYLVFVRNAKVIISCEISASKVIDLLYYLKFQKDVFYWVVGSGFVDRIKDGSISPKHYHFLKAILVQSPKMVEALEKAGLNNAIYIPNSKPIYYIPLLAHDYNSTRFVYLSRILPEKGTEYILDCIEKLNKEGFSDKVSMTFYGVVSESYKNFKERVESIPNVEYKGKLNLTSIDGYRTLSSYDMMLFPTFYEGEGFPGVFIDAFIAGLPVIASDWHYNSEVIKNGETGYIIPTQDKETLYSMMKYVIESRDIIEPLRKKCKDEAQKYDRDIVLGVSNLRRIGLIN